MGYRQLLAVDEKAGKVYVASNKDAVIDKQAFALNLDGSNADKPVRITRQDGWHEDQFAANGKVFVDTFSDPATPPRVSIHRPDGSFVEWLERNALDADHPYGKYLADHLPTEFGTLPAHDGQTMYWSMIKPPHFDASRRYPVFLSVYGGPHTQMVSRAWTGTMMQYFAQQGYIVFALDNHGSSRRERRFSDPIYGRFGAHEVDGQLTDIDWLAMQPYVDPKRIGVFGWSHGGYMTLRLLEAGSDKIAMGVAVAPVTDWKLYDTHWTERYVGGTPQSNPQGYVQAGVLAHLDGLKSPLLVVHGMADDNVLFTNTTALIDGLVNRNVQFELMTYPGAKHSISSRAGQRHVYGLIDGFFRRNLRPEQPQ